VSEDKKMRVLYCFFWECDVTSLLTHNNVDERDKGVALLVLRALPKLKIRTPRVSTKLRSGVAAKFRLV
jgi:hypothetical protein